MKTDDRTLGLLMEPEAKELLKQAFSLAVDVDQLPSLMRSVDNLMSDRFFNRPSRVYLMPDTYHKAGDPPNFYWVRQVYDVVTGEWSFAMNGGLIYHGPDSGWSIHT
jgi:hypothetical protein